MGALGLCARTPYVESETTKTDSVPQLTPGLEPEAEARNTVQTVAKKSQNTAAPGEPLGPV